MPGAVTCIWLMYQEVACEQAPKWSEEAGPVRIWGEECSRWQEQCVQRAWGWKTWACMSNSKYVAEQEEWRGDWASKDLKKGIALRGPWNSTSVFSFISAVFLPRILISPYQKQVFMNAVRNQHLIKQSDSLKTWDISANTSSREILFLKLAATVPRSADIANLKEWPTAEPLTPGEAWPLLMCIPGSLIISWTFYFWGRKYLHLRMKSTRSVCMQICPAQSWPG